MKKICLCFILLILSPLFLTGCSSEREINSYKIDIVFDDESKSLSAEEIVCYVNNSDNAFDNLYFHLYPNAFREGAKNEIVPISQQSLAYPNGKSYGFIKINEVKIEEKQIDFIIEGEDENILNIPLENRLFPDEKVKIFIDFQVVLPNINHRFGYGNYTINLANFYPIACVYEDGSGFKKDLYTNVGDPFYSDVSDYEVSISYDESLTLASSGEMQTFQQNEMKKSVCKGEKIRDFALVLSEDFKTVSTQTDEVKINYFYTNDVLAEANLELSKKALAFFSEKFGKYPYSQLSVVQNDFVYGGMEYPNLVMISNAIPCDRLSYVIVHEIAHQWWYGVVGNDEYNEAWVDEALTEFSTCLFFENNGEYGYDYDQIVTNAASSFKTYYNIYKKVCGEVETRMNKRLDEFGGEFEYFQRVYTQGIILYDSLRQTIGEKKMYKCLQDYFERYKFENSSGDKLISSFSKSSGRNLEEFFNSFLNGDVLVN